MGEKVTGINQEKTVPEKVEDLINLAKDELSKESTKEIVKKVKVKMKERRAAKKVLDNIDREVEELKLEIAQELEATQ